MHIRNEDIATAKDEWGTPPELFKKLDAEFHFQIDAAATLNNAKCIGYFDKEANALEIDTWIPDGYNSEDIPISDEFYRIFLNPPYSNGNLEKFMKKAYIESLKGAIVVCLVPFSGAGWFKRWAMKAYEIRIIGRVRFVGYKKDGTTIRNTPTFDSCIVIFDVEAKKKWFAQNPNTIFPLLLVF
jgi:phage N-6-adenine-methyltransferase